ncbi:MAG: hypothetical protein ACK2T5_06730, partial [Anaerolineales bacterium]
MSRKLFVMLGLLAALVFIMAACAPTTPEKEVVVETVVVEKEGQTVIETVVVEKEGQTVVETVVVEVEAEKEPVTRQGAWVDTVIVIEEPSSDSAVTRLEAGDIDVFAYNIA